MLPFLERIHPFKIEITDLDDSFMTALLINIKKQKIHFRDQHLLGNITILIFYITKLLTFNLFI